jgi:hypothetical protein
MRKFLSLAIIVLFGSLLLITGMHLSGFAYAQGNLGFTATLSGTEVVPPVKTSGTGMANFEVSENSLSYQVNILNTAKVTSVQIHKGTPGTNGDAIATVFKPKDNGRNLIENMPKISDISSTTQRSSSFSYSGNIDELALTGPLKGKTVSDLVLAMQSGETYVVVHTEDYPKGELRGQILENEG